MNILFLRNYRNSFKKKGLSLLFSAFFGIIFFVALPTFAQSDSLTFYFGKAELPHPATYVLTGKITSQEGGDALVGAGVHVNGIFSGVVTLMV